MINAVSIQRDGKKIAAAGSAPTTSAGNAQLDIAVARYHARSARSGQIRNDLGTASGVQVGKMDESVNSQ
jgi:hypothetical protein